MIEDVGCVWINEDLMNNDDAMATCPQSGAKLHELKNTNDLTTLINYVSSKGQINIYS